MDAHVEPGSCPISEVDISLGVRVISALRKLSPFRSLSVALPDYGMRFSLVGVTLKAV